MNQIPPVAGLRQVVRDNSIVKNYPETSASLIAKIKNPNNAAAWATFEKLYRPVIFRTARAKGLQYADAADLAQLVLVSVSKSIESYQRTEDGPPFRNWLSKVTRNAILKALSRQPQDRAHGGTQVLDVLSQVPNQDAATNAMIDHEVRRETFQLAAEKVRKSVQPLTWLAFEMSVLQQEPNEVVASRLEISIGNVYAARSRVIRRLKEAVKQLEFDSQYESR